MGPRPLVPCQARMHGGVLAASSLLSRALLYRGCALCVVRFSPSAASPPPTVAQVCPTRGRWNVFGFPFAVAVQCVVSAVAVPFPFARAHFGSRLSPPMKLCVSVVRGRQFASSATHEIKKMFQGHSSWRRVARVRLADAPTPDPAVMQCVKKGLNVIL